MRVTNNMIARGFLSNVNAQMRRMDKLHQQLSSGKSIRVPSDDPAGTASVMRLYSHLGQTVQFRDNVNAAVSWLEATDSTLNEVTQALHRAKELAVNGASGTHPEAARTALADEVDQILLHMADLANSTHTGLYLFAGNRTLTKPYDVDPDHPIAAPPDYEGDDGERRYEIGDGVTVAVNMDGQRVFDPIFDALIRLRDGLRAGDMDELAGPVLEDLESSLDLLLSARADIGARTNRLSLAGDRLDELELNIEQLLLDTEGVDIARALTDLKVTENVYRSALASGARIIQPTLLDFLR